MKNYSIWQDAKLKDICPSLKENLEVDVLIIGGGITGLSTAYHLKDSKLKVCLVEKNTIGSGVTSKTTGKLTYLQESYSDIKMYHGLEDAKLYLESQKDAIKLVSDIIGANRIKCDLEKVDSYIFSTANSKKLTKELSVLDELKVKYATKGELPNKNKVNDSYYVSDTYVFHPIKYLDALKKICLKNNLSIYENTNIENISKIEDFYLCSTNGNCLIKAKYVVLALHYPYFLKPFWMPLKTYIEKSYIMAYKSKDNLNFSAISVSKPIISIRYHSDKSTNYQLYLTGSHNAAIKENDKENFKMLLDRNAEPDYLWSNNDVMTSDKLPYIGSITDDKTLLLATGYNTWGMTNASLAGKILSDIILGKNNKYIRLFNPKRGLNLGKVINFPLVLGSNAYSFMKSKINKQKPWYPGSVYFTKKNGKSVGIYLDENGKEHIVYTICPHLKCSLTFNAQEKTWDCPCHGSRFDIDGKCIEGPSNYDITFKE